MFSFKKSLLSRIIRGILQGKTLFFIFILLSSFLHATIINVPVPYTSIQAGIDAAANSDTVLVQPGTYVENINYNGKNITVGSLFLTTQDTTYISTTIIDGNSSGSVVTFENGEDSTAVLCGFTITNGSADLGGGICCDNSSPSLQNVTITGNSANMGGGIYCGYNSSPNLQNVTISDNSASSYGGGIFMEASSNPSLENVTITGNSANINGGGIWCNASSPSLINSILWNDSPEEIYIVAGGSVTATYSDIQGSWTGTGNIDADPLFVNPGIGDYHLQPTSPCIDAGDPASPLDPDSTIADMGAYYFHQYINANFIADTTNGYVPLTVNFTDLSTSNSGVIDEWYWDFGDGNNSYLQDPANEYLLPGNYTVLLTVTNVNDSTDTETKVDYITVNPPAYIGPVWHISTTGSDVWGNGSTPYPFSTIQHGINAASNADTVLVAEGTYEENINYNGKLISVGSLFLTSQDTTYISSTIIDGNSSGSVVTFNHSEDSTTVLCGFTITNGLASGSYPSNCGGGIFCDTNSSPSLQNVTILSNSASYGGGIFCEDYSSPSLQNVTISSNSANYGGGIHCELYSNPSLENVTITGNSASSSGGGIWCNASSPSLINSILWNDSPEEINIVSGGSVTATYSDIENGTGQTWFGTGCIDSDPLFVDSGNGDYHLQLTSPCIDAGDPASPLDPDGTIADMGAYYFHQLPPEADFTADTTNGEVPLTVNFTDLSTQGYYPIDEWYWDFGDGNNSSLQNPTNEYQLPGSYTVSLTVTDVNDSTDTETKTDYISVNPPAYIGPVWHISTTSSDIWGNGSTQYPFATIQHGINTSADTDTVLVQLGTYLENIDFNGKFITVGSLFLTTQSATYISSTIIDGSSSGSVVKFENSEDSNAILCGFTIINGSAEYGGGIYCYSSSPSLQNIIITDNFADYYGSGIYCTTNSSPSFENVTITGNSADYNGGGIYCYSSSPSLDNVTITGNSAVYYGGGISCHLNSSPILQNVTISDNSAAIGGGIYCWSISNPSLINSILWNNSPQEIFINSSSVTATYSDIQGGWTGTGNIDSDPLFADSGNGDYHLTWANFPIPDSTMSPCIDTGDPSSPFDPDGTIADMGAFYFDKSPGAPVITAVTDVPDDQGRYVQVIWNRSPYDAPNSPVTIESYSVWRYDDIFRDGGIFEIYEDPREIFEKAAKNSDKNYYWQRDDEILTFITQLPAVGYAQYSVVSPTLIDSSVVSINYSVFKILAHTDVTLIYYPSIPDSGYSVDNIAPDETRVYIAQNGSNIGLSWDEVEYGTFQGNSYPELNGIWYKIYAGDSPDFICDETHLVDTVTDLNYDYPITGEEKKFFKIVVSDQPEAGRSINRFKKPEEPAGDYRKARR